jgi:putative Mg2+ transporter-C (MgtC) family protein
VSGPAAGAGIAPGLAGGGSAGQALLAVGESALEQPGQVVVRLLVAFVLTYALGFERELRGSPAGERTFALIGLATAMIGILAGHGAANALVGAVTGVGFIGGGLTFRQSTSEGDVLRGITTAAAIFAAAAIGSACGEGFLIAATLGTALLLLVLELGRLPGLKVLNARRWTDRFADDEEYAVAPPATHPADPAVGHSGPNDPALHHPETPGHRPPGRRPEPPGAAPVRQPPPIPDAQAGQHPRPPDDPATRRPEPPERPPGSAQ